MPDVIEDSLSPGGTTATAPLASSPPDMSGPSMGDRTMDTETLAPPPPGVWKRLITNPLAAGSLIILTFIVLCALLAPVIAPQGFAAQDLKHRLEPPSA